MPEALQALALLAAMIGALRALDHLFLGHRSVDGGARRRCWYCGRRAAPGQA